MQAISDTIIWNTSWDGLLSEDNIDLKIINVDNKSNNPFNGIYEGSFSYQLSPDTIVPGYAYGSIDRIGMLRFFLKDQNPFVRFEGLVSPDGNLLATAFKEEGQILDSAVSNRDSLLNLQNENLRFSIFLTGVPEVDSIRQFDFVLMKQ